MRCEEIMKRNPEYVTENDTVAKAARSMRDRNIGFLPVCDPQNRPIGTITDRDLAIRILAEGKGADVKVADCMSKETITCKASDDVTRCEELMSQHRKSRMMIVDDAGKLVGVISLSDVALKDQAHAAQTMRAVSQREARA